MEAPKVILHLLDDTHTIPTQTWKFEHKSVIRIGRADENEVVIRLPTVSRLHAELCWKDTHWVLINRSRMGTVVYNLTLDEVELPDEETAFQLGRIGPMLALTGRETDPNESGQTVGSHWHALPDVSAEKTKEQVEGIVDTPYFQELQRLARKLKGSEKAQDAPGNP